MQMENHSTGELRGVVLDASPINDIDSAGVNVLLNLAKEFESKNILFLLASCRGESHKVKSTPHAQYFS